MTPASKYKKPSLGTLRQAATIVAVVSGLFSLIVSILLVMNYSRTTAEDPMNAPKLESLRGRFAANPDDKDLRDQVRQRDLTERRSFFTRQARNRTGALMLLISMGIFLASLKTASELEQRLPSPTPSQNGEDPAIRYSSARKMVAIFGIALASALLLLSLMTPDPIPLESESSPNVVTASLPSENWPCFRGPEGNAVAHYTNVPTSWNGKTGENILWKTPIPLPGVNSPIVWENRIFISGADGKTKEVYAFDANTGEMLWRRCITGIPGSPSGIPEILEDTGHAAPTMATDGERVFAIFSNGDLVCLDLKGTPIWSHALGMPNNMYGHSSSLITYHHLLIVQFDDGDAPRLTAFNTKTGEIVWEHVRPATMSWASPILVRIEGRPQLILNSLPIVSGHNPATGKENWSVECMDGDVAPSPVYHDGFIYVTSEAAVTAGIQLGAQPSVVWEYENDLPDTSSPAAAHGLVFTASSGGVITCLDAKDGTLHWSKEYDEGFYSSPVVVGDNIYLMDMTGLMRIFKVSKEYQLLAECELGEPSTCTPAFLDNRIYIRTKKHLYGITNGQD
jgi:outer membrane protein assembly factor BamB